MRYARDPRWMVAKYAGKDAKGNPFPAGARVFYFPSTKTFYQGADAEREAAAFNAAAEDEAAYARQYGGGYDGGDGW